MEKKKFPVIFSPEEIEYLKENDIPCCPNLYIKSKAKSFKQYCSKMKLAAFRDFKYKDSEELDNYYKKERRK